MIEDREITEFREYINELKTIKSEVLQIIKEGNDKALSKAAKYYPGKVNQLLSQRNIISGRGCFPFFDLAFINQRKKNLELLDLNTRKEDIDLLLDAVRRIDQELEEL